MRTRTHGVNGTYQNGCRCDACKAAHAETARRNRERDPDAQKRSYLRNRTARIAAAKAWNRAHPEKRRSTHLKRQYGITDDEYIVMAARQNGQCGICGKAKQLVVDHDHNTGRIRGLLCRQCNAAIGQLGDNPALLRSALKWLEE